MAKVLLLLAALSGFTGVALGAFAAHALRSRLPEKMLGVFQTGVQYQLWHTAALIGVALLLLRWPESALFKASGALFVVGILLFSGSLYLMTLGGLRLGMVTPIGGVCFLAAWVCFGMGVWRSM
ncbi:Uncharacterized membrane protein YgdD, TMEM256/DUF423 family [Halopseudomonas litoralis]|uniref:Uncharacterized membrane protein YgdD, TMEM256/DUF423 family n=1 Tax=Halopseudomonas litoralis TaxID=797277 RepID=A0A1H1XHM3_9GAMM|nr:DUF423 domain-containing protein [Halopseudomonas litoralis]SDT08632.1 Uncharacterized membrane protein YgdD, TMEM256/DUF423 family [Halopseudomonas litoralis]